MLGDNWSSRQLRKALTEEYPYLLPRKMTTGEVHSDYDYQFIVGEYDLPEGWMELFLQCCEDLKEPLVKVINTQSLNSSANSKNSLRQNGSPPTIGNI